MLYFRFVTSVGHNDRPTQHLRCVLHTVHQRWMTKWPKGIRGLASMNKTEMKNRGAQIFQKSRSQLKILVARIVTWSKFHTEDPQILGTTVKKISRHGDLASEIYAPLMHNTFAYNQRGNRSSCPKRQRFRPVIGDCLVRPWTATTLSEVSLFFSSSQQLQTQYNYVTADFFHNLSNSLFTQHPNIRSYTVRDTASLNKEKNKG
jgi:hypothetical protein